MPDTITTIPLSEYLGSKEADYSPEGSASTLYQAKPSTSEVIRAQVDEIFTGAGSLKAYIDAGNVSREAKTGVRLSKEEWEASEYFRPGINFFDGITNNSAQILAERYDNNQDNAFALERASTLQRGLGLGVGLVAGVFEPVNLVSGVAAALATGGLGSAIPTIGRLTAVNSVRGAATRGAIEGVVGAALTEPGSLYSAKRLQEDYTLSDSLLNLGIGAILGGGLGAGTKALELRAARSIEDDIKLKTKEFDTALTQTIQGAAIDVEPVKSLQDIENIKIAKREIAKLDEKISLLKEKEGIVEPATISPEIRNLDSVKASTPNVVSSISETPDIINVTQASLPVKLRNSEEATSFLRQIVEYADTNSKKVIIDSSGSKLFKNTSIQRPYKDLGFTKNPKGQWERKAKKAQYSRQLQRLMRKQKEWQSKLTTAKDPSIPDLEHFTNKVNTSSAYSEKDISEISKYFDEFKDIDDQIQIERELESFQAELLELQAKGLISNEELAIINNLSDIDKESSIFDNVLFAAKICLTRG